MSRKAKHDLETRIQIVKEYQRGQTSLKRLGLKYGLNGETVRQMVSRYESEGTEGLQNKSQNKQYSTELRVQAVKDYLSGKGSALEICCKNKISAPSVLRKWIMWYNGHKEFKERSLAKGEIYMTKGRKTTQEERLRQENKILQAKIKDQEMEIALLKKLRELRGGDW